MDLENIIIAGLIISTIAGVLSAIAFIPQTVKSLVTKSTSGLSIGFVIFGITASTIWIIWGVLSSVFASSLVNDSSSTTNPAILAAQTAAPIWTNALVLIWSLALLFSKIRNINISKKQNLTEQEYSNLQVTKIYYKHKDKKSLHSKIILKIIKSSLVQKEEL